MKEFCWSCEYGGCQSTRATFCRRVDAFVTMVSRMIKAKEKSQGLTEADKYYADNDSEDEGMQVIQKRKNHQVTQARNNVNAIKWRIS
ncbi:hypothetical protein QL285_067277 [Trifolium repens]|nr:hypothetical protein QL285_067277 [Trifolium repens]